MTLDFLGAEQNLTILAGEKSQYKWEFVDGETGEPVDISNVTFDGMVTFPDGHTEPIDIAFFMEEINVLHLTFPQLNEVASYAWEVRATSDAGDKIRVAHGKIGTLPTSLELFNFEDATEERRLFVRLPSKGVAHAMMLWRASTMAAMYASFAQKMAEEAQQLKRDCELLKEECEELLSMARDTLNTVQELVKGWEEQLKEDLNKAVEELERKADEILDGVDERLDALEKSEKEMQGLLKEFQIFIATFEEKVASVVWVDWETGHLFIGGQDTGAKVTGEPGKSPFIDENDHWQYWDDNKHAWQDGGSARGADGFSPYVDGNGFLVYKDPVTGQIVVTTEPLKGRDGIDGDSVRRKLVDRVEDIPNEGETCTGAWYYYVENKDEMPRAIIEVLGKGRTAKDTIQIDGRTIALPDASMNVNDAAKALGTAIDAVCEELRVEVEGAKVKLYCDIHITLTVNRTGTGYTVIEIPMVDGEGYRVFAWLEKPDGTGGWVQVGMANDVASKEVYGLVKLGTDTVIKEGGAVGVNADGEMNVASAEYTVRGVAMLSNTDVLDVNVGGTIARNKEGRIVASPMTNKDAGVVKVGWSGIAEEMAEVVGLTGNGTLGVAMAGEGGNYGVVKLTDGLMTAARPYTLFIGLEDSTKGIASNLMVQGALQYVNGGAWRSKMENRVGGKDVLGNDTNYLGLFTSNQFSQSERGGMELLSASTSLLAGVYLATMNNDNRENAVPSAAAVRTWTTNNFYTKTQLDGDYFNKMKGTFYTKSEVDGTVMQKFQEWVKANFYTKEEFSGQVGEAAGGNFLSKADADKTYWKTGDGKAYVDKTFMKKTDAYTKAETDERLGRKMGCGSLWTALEVVHDGDDIEALSSQNPTTMYVLV